MARDDRESPFVRHLVLALQPPPRAINLEHPDEERVSNWSGACALGLVPIWFEHCLS